MGVKGGRGLRYEKKKVHHPVVRTSSWVVKKKLAKCIGWFKRCLHQLVKIIKEERMARRNKGD